VVACPLCVGVAARAVHGLSGAPHATPCCGWA